VIGSCMHVKAVPRRDAELLCCDLVDIGSVF